ncbi:MAG: 2-C-methyl-D-erythritol 2,4-cyclodiphosphate synthase [Candidatus Azotimanducaceae bacterium]|jgi:2-C-methyl-D-erythritol 2,4-cyclodiphosphate synthase
MSNIRIGHGYDVHALAEGNGLVLGGVNISCNYSIIAHSDGDVLIHALCDALLGAMGKGDIGFHFSDTDVVNKNRDSREFLRIIRSLMTDEHFQLGNADVTIVAQSPKMAPHLDSMKQKLALDLDAETSQLNIKATTTEHLGFTGRKEGIAVHAVVLLEKII